MITGTYRMVRQSERIGIRCDELEEHNNGPSLAPANWQELLAAMETRMLRAEEEARKYRLQAERQVSRVVAPQVQAPAPAPPEAEVNRKPLLEMLQNHHPPTFEGSTDPFIAEQWMDVITSMLTLLKLRVLIE